MLYMCGDVVWSQLGLTTSRDHGEGDVHLKSKMATSKLKFLSLFSLKIWDFITKYVYPYQIECFKITIMDKCTE